MKPFESYEEFEQFFKTVKGLVIPYSFTDVKEGYGSFCFTVIKDQHYIRAIWDVSKLQIVNIDSVCLHEKPN